MCILWRVWTVITWLASAIVRLDQMAEALKGAWKAAKGEDDDDDDDD